ncbi:MAG TPA: hypothetical protein PK243_11230, partial [Flexilinea sp.]|nr:hypothetical protein [Flexilinea sp.]
MSLKLLNNDAFRTLSISTGVSENQLNDRIIERLKRHDIITGNETCEQSIQSIADEINTPIDDIISMIFFSDEKSQEIPELMKSIYISPVIYLKQSEVDKICSEMRGINVDLDWDHDDGKIVDREFDSVIDPFYLTWDMSVYEYGKSTTETRTNPAEYTMQSRTVDVANLIVYKDDIECTIDEPQY